MRKIMFFMIVAILFALIAIFAFMAFFLIIFVGSQEQEIYLLWAISTAMVSCIIYIYLSRYSDRLQLKWDSDEMSRLHNRRNNC